MEQWLAIVDDECHNKFDNICNDIQVVRGPSLRGTQQAYNKQPDP